MIDRGSMYVVYVVSYVPRFILFLFSSSLEVKSLEVK